MNINWTLVEIVTTIIVIIALFPFVLFALSRKSIFFTRLESGNIKYIYHGDTLHRVIADVRKKKISEHKLVEGDEKRTWWEKQLGLFWVGIPPFASVRWFKITRRKEHEELSGKGPTEWIADLGSTRTDSLRAVFPRPFLLNNVELGGDRQEVNLLVIGKFKVVDTYKPVPELKGDFFTLLGSTLRGAIITILGKKRAGIDWLLWAEKGAGPKSILSVLCRPKSDFNKVLRERIGLEMVEIVISHWDPSDPKARAAMNARFIAEKAREATLIAADAYAKELDIKTGADAQRVRDLADARGEHVRKTLRALVAEGGTPDEMVRAAARILRAESLPNLTTLVEGDSSARVVVPVGGNN